MHAVNALDIRIFDFDGSVSAQSALMAQYRERIKTINLKRYAHRARLWTSPRQFSHISKEAFTASPSLSLLGSGDFHHFSLALIAQHAGPLTVVLFDNHPDWMRPPHQYHCGTWVHALARLPQVARIVIIGLESGDINDDKFKQGDVESFRSGKVVLLPFKALEANLDKTQTITLSSKLQGDLDHGIAEILSAINTKQVYISVDKDCLRNEDAYTNWEQGSLSLSVVLACISGILKQHQLVGADTVGDFSPPSFRSPLKWLGSWLDRPAYAFKFAQQQHATQLNQTANLQLIKAFDGLL